MKEACGQGEVVGCIVMNYIIFGRTVQLANFPCSRWQHWNNKHRKEFFKLTRKQTSGFRKQFDRVEVCVVCVD